MRSRTLVTRASSRGGGGGRSWPLPETVMNGSGPSGKVLKGRDPVPACVCVCRGSEITAPLGLPHLE